MNYLEKIEDKIQGYKKRGYGRKKILLKFIAFNFKLLFSNKFEINNQVINSNDVIDNHKINTSQEEMIKSSIKENFSKFFSTKMQNNYELRIAFRTNGGFGNVLIHANFIKYFKEYLENSNIKITVFGHPIKEMTDAIFDGLDFIDRYYNYTDLNNNDFPYYDAVIDIHSFPEIIHVNWQRIHSIDLKLYKLLQIWNEFRQNDTFCRFFTLRPNLNSQIYLYGILNHKTCLTIGDINNELCVTNDYTISLKISKNEEERLSEFNLQKDKYITLQRGVNIFSGTNEAPKMWSLENFNKLVSLLKEKYKGIKIIQLGESLDRCKPIDNVDLCLVGKTDWNDIKILLKNALYHIDGECGMVHLRKALTNKPSVVLFGPTPWEFFSYKNNINIHTNACKHWCAALNDNWQKKCILGTPKCMQSITPEFVMQKISEYENNTSFTVTASKTIYEQLTNDKRIYIDHNWFSRFCKENEIFAYEIEDIELKDLKIFKFENLKWDVIPISESPCLEYLKGNKKAYSDYIEYKNKYNLGDVHTIERFNQLIKTFSDSNTVHVIINSENVILDGQHRACIKLHQKGLNQRIKVIKLYF